MEDSAATLYKMAGELARQNRRSEALKVYLEVIRQKPEFANAHARIGMLLFQGRKFSESEGYFRRALSLDPDNPHVLNELGKLLLWDGRLDAAELALRKAVLGAPGRYGINLGNLFWRKGKFDEAEKCFRHALTLNENDHGARHNLGNLQLLRENWEEGWTNLDGRFFSKSAKPKFRGLPDKSLLWRGEDIRGKKLLAWSELGFGDTIHFVRYSKHLVEMGIEVTVAVHAELVELLRACLPWKVDIISRRSVDPEAWEHHVALMSLPGIIDRHLDKFQWDKPYLRIRNECSRGRWGLPADKKLVGLVWATSRVHAMLYNHKSIAARALVNALLGIPGVVLVGLQVGVDAPRIKPLLQARVITPTLETGSFLEHAELVTQLDAVVTVDTAMAHLAGALGVPVWTLLSFVPDWRWGLRDNTTRWYPSMRLVRQTALGDWREALALLLRDLNATLALPSN